MIGMKDFESAMIKNRGKVSNEVELGIVSYGLLFKKVELDKPKYYVEKYSVPILKYVFGELVTVENVIEYIMSIEKAYGITNSILSEGFRELCNRIPDDTYVKECFEALNTITVESDEDIIEAFRAILYAWTTKNRNLGNGFYGNEYLSKLEYMLLNVQPKETVYDGYCGYGESLVRWAKDDTVFAIQDINRDTIVIATINMIISGVNRFTVSCGDTNIKSENHYKYIFSEPPFAARYDTNYLSEVASDLEFSSSKTIIVERIVSLLNDEGRAVILVGAGFLFSTSMEKKLRRRLYEQGWIEAIIELPGGVLLPYSGVHAAILVINKAKTEKEFLMVDSSALWKKNPRTLTMELLDDAIVKIKELVYGKIEEDRVSKLVSFEDDNDYNFTPSYYINPYDIKEVVVSDIKELLKNERELLNKLNIINGDLDKIRKNR